MSAFVSHDREDAQGIRAEVHVNTIKGKVKSIDDSNPKSAKAMFTVEWLKFPVGGWLIKEEEAYKILQDAYAKGEEVEVRIESKRKKNIDRSLPISELRSTAEEAQKNTTSVVVAVNGTYTSEALTHPSEDPATGDAQQALPVEAGARRPASSGGSAISADDALATLRTLATTREVSNSVVDAVAAAALIAGATPQQVIEASTVSQAQPAPQAGYSYEAPSYKEYNSDGRTNLGNYAVTAAVGAESFVTNTVRELTNDDPKHNVIEFYTQLVLGVADRIQTSAYGEGFRLDRAANSHVRVRSIVYDVIRHEYKLPLAEDGGLPSFEAATEWVQNVGKRARARFLFAAQVAYNAPGINAILATLNEDATTAAPAVTPEPVAEVVAEPVVAEPVVEAPVVEEVTYVTDEPSLTAEEEEAAAAKAAPAPAKKAAAKAAPVAETAPATFSDDLLTFPAQILAPGAINAQNTPSEDTIEQFKDFVQEGMGLTEKSDIIKVGKLLAQTFGKSYNKAQNIPEDLLLDFIDFYVAAGEDNFRAVLATF